MDRENAGVMIAFGVGLVAGAAAALLLAPYSGREVREKIGEGILDSKNYVKGYATGARDATAAAVSAAKDAFREAWPKPEQKS